MCRRMLYEAKYKKLLVCDRRSTNMIWYGIVPVQTIARKPAMLGTKMKLLIDRIQIWRQVEDQSNGLVSKFP